MAGEPGSTADNAHEITVTRVFDASPETLWKAWTQPERFARWFRTPPFTTPSSSVAMDVRTGGEWRATQVSSVDGTQLPFVGVYKEVTEPERLVFSFENPEDRSDPNVEIATVTFRSLDGKTEMAFHQSGHLPEEQYPLLKEGYSRFFDQLEQYLSEG